MPGQGAPIHDPIDGFADRYPLLSGEWLGVSRPGMTMPRMQWPCDVSPGFRALRGNSTQQDGVYPYRIRADVDPYQCTMGAKVSTRQGDTA